MRFKRPSIDSIILIAASVYILFLSFESQLNLYIHPRYILFTLAMALVSLILVIIHSMSRHSKDSKSSWISLVSIMAILLFAVFLPARTLTSATFTQRLTDSGSIIGSTDSEALTDVLAGSSKSLKLIDWSRLLDNNSDPGFYQNRPATISGFIFDADLGPDTFLLSRFVLTCCAVDSQPIGIPVRLINWQDFFNEDEWVSVEGDFALAETANGEQIVLIPKTISRIEQPKDPYAN